MQIAELKDTLKPKAGLLEFSESSDIMNSSYSFGPSPFWSCHSQDPAKAGFTFAIKMHARGSIKSKIMK